MCAAKGHWVWEGLVRTLLKTDCQTLCLSIHTGETFVTRKVTRSVAQIHLGQMESVSKFSALIEITSHQSTYSEQNAKSSF